MTTSKYTSSFSIMCSFLLLISLPLFLFHIVFPFPCNSFITTFTSIFPYHYHSTLISLSLSKDSIHLDISFIFLSTSLDSFAHFIFIPHHPFFSIYLSPLQEEVSDEDLEGGGKAAGGDPVTSQPPPSTNPFRYAGRVEGTKGAARDRDHVNMERMEGGGACLRMSSWSRVLFDLTIWISLMLPGTRDQKPLFWGGNFSCVGFSC